MKQKLIIREYAYLARPIWDWTLVNDAGGSYETGGSFSNSGQHYSRKACLKECERYMLDVEAIEYETING